VVDILADLTRKGVTVLLSIHQPRPDILRLMSRVLILSADGQVWCPWLMLFDPNSHPVRGYSILFETV
jgi:hypothetical protein